MINVAIYARVSTDAQAKAGDSIPAQLDALRKYISDNKDMVLVDEYVDDGISGTKFAERDELQRMLSDAKEGKIDLLLFTKLDRFYRSIRHYTATQEVLDRCNVGWKAIWEPVYDTTTPAGRLIVNQMMSIAQFEAENTSQRIKQVFAYKVRQGEVIAGKQPIGYSIVNKHLVPNEDAEIIRGLFKYYDMTNSLTKATLWLREHGIQRAKFMTKEILTNTKYVGIYRDNKNYCEPIIDTDLFRSVQDKLRKNIKYNQKHTYIFSGLLRCAECGRKMQAYQSHNSNGRKTYIYPRYRCKSHYLRTELYTCSNTKVVHQPTLERYMLENIRQEVENLKLTYELVETKKVDNSKKIANLKKRLGKLKELYLNDLLSLEEYKSDMDDILTKIQKLDGETEKHKIVDLSALEELLATGFEGIYATMTDEEKRYFWRSIIKEIQFNSKKEFKIIFF